VETSARPRTAIGVVARAPSAPGKSRLAPHLSAARLLALRVALLADVLRVVSALKDVDRFLFFTPDEAEQELAAMCGGAFTLRPQRGGDLGQRMHAVFEELLVDGGYESAILIGSDLPLFTAAHFAAARDRLRKDWDVALGPAADGGYYLIGLRTPVARLFEDIDWGAGTVLFDTVRNAVRLGLAPKIIERLYDLDTIEDLRRLERDLTSAPDDVAPHIRKWFRSE
jgi:rSAM/selenodomain-associated transferase 1